MNQPSEQHEPKHGRKAELKNRYQEPALEQLPKARNKKAAKRGDDVAGRSLSCHKIHLYRAEDRATSGFTRAKRAREDSNFKPSDP